MTLLSVVKGNRAETAKNLEAANAARALCVYTITICKSEKNFPKRNRWLLTQPIVEQSVKAYTHIRKANAIKVVAWDDYKLRRKHQIKARTCCEALLGLIDIAYEVLGENGVNIEHWVKLTTQAENILAAWRASDRKRYKELKDIPAQEA